MIKNFNIAFVGMSHLGLNTAVASSKYLNRILCLDEDEKKIKKINNLEEDFGEPGLKEKLKNKKKFFLFSSNFKLLKKAELIYLSIDTRTNNLNKSNFFEVKKLFNKILNHKKKRIPIIILSQLSPGLTDQLSKTTNEKIYYQVETLIFGNALNRATYPERIIVGCKNVNENLNLKYESYLRKFKCRVIKTNYKSAELSKISINMYLISSISLTNSLVQICKNINADWKSVKEALQLDKRIGKYAYLDPGLGISGGNLERDLENILGIIKRNKIKNIYKNLFLSFKNISNHSSQWVEEILKKNFKNLKDKKIGILGVSYKENTNSIKNSKSISLIRKFCRYCEIIIFDPLVRINNIHNVYNANNIEETIQKTNILIIMNKCKDFFNIENIINKSKCCKFVLDPFQVLKKRKLNIHKKYISLT